MSNKVLNLVWSCEHFGTKDGKELLVMLALADWASDDGEAWPSIAQLCKKARISERHWYRIRPKLLKAGFIQITEKGGPIRNNRNDRRSNLYRIILSKLQASEKRNDPDGLTPSKARHVPDTVSAPSVFNDPDIAVGTTLTCVSDDPDIARREIHHIIEPSYKEPSVVADASPLSLFSGSTNFEKRQKNDRKPELAKKPPAAPTLDSILEELKPIYPWVDVQTERARIRGWLFVNPHRKVTKRFIVRWFNKIDRPAKGEAPDRPQSFEEFRDYCASKGIEEGYIKSRWERWESTGWIQNNRPIVKWKEGVNAWGYELEEEHRKAMRF
jgi:hypothetical protein